MNPVPIIILGICLAVLAFVFRRKPQHVEIFLDTSGSIRLQDAVDTITDILGQMRNDISITFSTFDLKITSREVFDSPLEAAVIIKDMLIIGKLASLHGSGTDYTCIAAAIPDNTTHTFVITDLQANPVHNDPRFAKFLPKSLSFVDCSVESEPTATPTKA